MAFGHGPRRARLLGWHQPQQGRALVDSVFSLVTVPE
jgi:hypothetical protein